MAKPNNDFKDITLYIPVGTYKASFENVHLPNLKMQAHISKNVILQYIRLSIFSFVLQNLLSCSGIYFGAT